MMRIQKTKVYLLFADNRVLVEMFYEKSQQIKIGVLLLKRNKKSVKHVLTIQRLW